MKNASAEHMHREPTMWLDVASLIAFPRNPRIHPPLQIEALKSTLLKFGMISPLTVQRSTKYVLGGNGRLEALKQLGWKQVECKVIDVDDKAALLENAALNQLGEMSTWNDKLLAENLLEGLSAISVDPLSIGFEKAHLDRLSEALDASTSSAGMSISEHVREAYKQPEEDAPQIEVAAIAKQGDVWLLGGHKLYVGDATSPEWLELVKAFEPDTMWTDPPYGISFKSNSRQATQQFDEIENDDLDEEALQAFLHNSVQWARESVDYAYVCCPWKTYGVFVKALGQPRNVIVWDKGNGALGHGYRYRHEFVLFYGQLKRDGLNDVWQISRDPAQQYAHPTQKPVALSAKALSDCSARKAVDPFGGSGSSLLAAEHLGVQMLTCELEPKYADIIIARWERLTMKKATKAVKKKK